MGGPSQPSAEEPQRPSLLAQFIAQHGSGSRRAPSASELRALREELERISARAAARAAQLESSQAPPARGAANDSGASAAAGAADPAGTRRGSSDTGTEPGASAAAAGGGGRPESKRPKAGQPAPRASGSDSDASASNASGARSSSDSAAAGGASRPDADSSAAQQGTPAPSSGSASGAALFTASQQAKHSASAPVPDDFSRVKVTNQVPIQTYWAAMEPYFRSVTDEDIGYLESTADGQDSYTIPKLGKFYAYAWAEEEVAHFPEHMHNSKTRYIARALVAPDARPKSLQPAAVSGADLLDSDMSLNTARLAPLTERIVSALVAEHLVLHGGAGAGPDGDNDGGGGSGGSGGKDRVVSSNSGYGSGSDDSDAEMSARVVTAGSSSSSSGSGGSSGMPSLEDRLKRELQYIGILDEGDVDWDDREDDEVCVTIRALQRQLREQVRVNRLRKERLLPIAREHSGYQEYTQVIDELDKQVEQSYLKRHRLTKSRKRKTAPAKTVSLSDNALNALGRRRRVIQAIGHLFPADKFALPSESIFAGIPPNPDVHMK
ncbi:Transcriptional regulator [Coemansia javaensis]|uniref:Transcriptional regulator n=1 Tax=Coemansia javaensis TaxID=2761396 RepID=A0A9W8H764_9FUNG|nr:Transcriptional regulator [Coemansia javaensis]